MKHCINLAIFSVILIAGCSCGSNESKEDAVSVAAEVVEQSAPQAEKPVVKENCFFVISKVAPEHLNVYEAVGKDTLLRASYPVCLSRNKGQKEKVGDYKTPESGPKEPFEITQIQDAHTWTHDFGDGRGKILAYGHWFMRLRAKGFSGIGIHGSTNNERSVPGRASEGCIRLLDKDIIDLHDRFATVGTKVYILHEGQGPLPFEKKCKPLPAKKQPKTEDASATHFGDDAFTEKPANDASSSKFGVPGVISDDGKNVSFGNGENQSKLLKPVASASSAKSSKAVAGQTLKTKKGERMKLATDEDPAKCKIFSKDGKNVLTDGSSVKVIKKVSTKDGKTYVKTTYGGKTVYINVISFE